MEQTQQRRVRVIPATKSAASPSGQRNGKRRVAAYCRVSTDSEEQLNSYEAQKTTTPKKLKRIRAGRWPGSTPTRVCPAPA